MSKKINFVKKFNLERFEKSAIIMFVLGIFVVFNFLLSFVSLRLDYSYGQNHTLSQSTKKIVSKLDDVINIKLYISSDLPLGLTSLRTDVIDLINEYQKASGGRIVYKVIDPKKNQEALSEVSSAGIPELQYSQIEKDKYAVATAYFGATMSYGGKTEVIPQLSGLETLEYDLTSRIYKLTQKEPIKIGLVNAPILSQNPQEDTYRTVRSVLASQYDLINYPSLEDGNKPDNTVKTLLVFDDNQKQFATSEVNIMRDYLKNNGSAVIMADGVKVVPEQLTTDAADHNLFDLVGEYGINIAKDLVLSTSAQLVNFGNGMVNFMSPYPFWIKTANIDIKNQNLSGIGVLIFPWASSLSSNQNTPGLKISTLVKSEKNSWIQKDNFTLDPNNIASPNQNELKEQSLVMESEKQGAGKIAVIPSSRFVKEQFLSRSSDNLGLIVNLVNNFASNGALSGIRTRTVASFPLKEVTDSEKEFYKYLNILLLPGIFALYGLYRITKKG
jgi:ABC-type uncharacterized transport system involved in gliding motility auxiliary subunit